MHRIDAAVQEKNEMVFVKLLRKLTGRNTTGPPCSRGAIIRLEAAWRHRLACAGEAACRLAVKCYRRKQTTDDDDRRQPPLIVLAHLHYV